MSVNLQEQYDKIYKYCYFKVKNKEIAEDLTQETFLKYVSQTSYINYGKPLAYLYTIAKNQCMDYFRQKKTETLDEAIASENTVTDVLTNMALRQAVEKLPAELAEIILLRFAGVLAIHEITAVLAISRFAVYRKMNAALKELRQQLKKEDFYE